MRSTVSSKGQVTIPAEIRERLGLRTGTTVVFEPRPGGALLRKGVGAQHPIDVVFGTLRLGRAVDAVLDEMRGPRPRGSRRRRVRQ